MSEDSLHRTLDAALARSGGPSAEDVGTLKSALAWIEANLPVDNLGHVTSCSAFGADCGCVTLARRLTAHTAAAEARGAERGARAVVEAVETAAREWTGEPSMQAAHFLAAAREAAAREGGA